MCYVKTTKAQYSYSRTEEIHTLATQGTSTSDVFVKDRAGKRELREEHCPSSVMLAKFFTNPFRGFPLKKFRDVIMGHCLNKGVFWNSC